MNSIKSRLVVSIFVVLSLACKKDDGISIPLESEANEFVWQGMRTYYFWQSEVPDLADDRFETFDDLHTFLNQFVNPESLFDYYLHDEDRFSWIVDDYEKLDNSLQGISKSFGYEFRLVRNESSGNYFGFVEYIIPNSPASNTDLKRGDIFHAVNGLEITQSNFRNLLIDAEMQTLSLGDFIDAEEGVVDNGKSISLVAAEIAENPVFLTKTFDVDGSKVGYLVYNQFISSYHSELNAALGALKEEGVTEMVLDLRYNSGGSITTARVLASMLYSKASNSTLMGSISYNERLAEFNTQFGFMNEVPLFNANGDSVGVEVMNRIDLNQLYILTSGSTASASELVIAGLQPYMNIILIGTKTVGKNVGSITLYDAPEEGYLTKVGINPNHTYAMQPIISQLSNAVGLTDYTNGFEPNFEVNELDHLDDLKPLGHEEEPMLSVALGMISGAGRMEKQPHLDMEDVYESRRDRPFSYIVIDSKEEKRKFLIKNILLNH